MKREERRKWKLVGSYAGMVGRRNTVVDLWELPSPNAVQATLSDPELAKYGPQISEIAKDETLTMMTKLPIRDDWLLKFFPSLGREKACSFTPSSSSGNKTLTPYISAKPGAASRPNCFVPQPQSSHRHESDQLLTIPLLLLSTPPGKILLMRNTNV